MCHVFNGIEHSLCSCGRMVSLVLSIVKTLERAELFNQCLCLSHTEQLLQQQPAWFQKWTFNLSVVESLRLARADSKSSILMLLDLSIAFDTVNHQILMSTLLVKGISGTALQWFVSYLTDRSVKVSWRGEVSKSQHLATGGPLGLISWTL